MKMKVFLPPLISLTIFAASLAGLLAIRGHAAEISVTDATSAVGTVTEVAPSEIVVRSETAAAPLRYAYTKATKCVDDSGASVAFEVVRAGLPVRVHYVVEGDRMIAERVVVRRAAIAEASSGAELSNARASSAEDTAIRETTTSRGVVSDLGDHEIHMLADSASGSTRYIFTDTTQYVDEGGAPISIQTVQSGVPVTIHYAREGEDLVARRVIVGKSTNALPPIAEEIQSTTTRSITRRSKD